MTVPVPLTISPLSSAAAIVTFWVLFQSVVVKVRAAGLTGRSPPQPVHDSAQFLAENSLNEPPVNMGHHKRFSRSNWSYDNLANDGPPLTVVRMSASRSGHQG